MIDPVRGFGYRGGSKYKNWNEKMMKNMIYESELKVLEILWNQGRTTAKELAIQLNASTNWNKTTSYTVIKKCIEKGLVERLETNFICHPLITREEAQKLELQILADKMFGGSSDLLIASLLGGSRMTASQFDKLRSMVQEFTAD